MWFEADYGAYNDLGINLATHGQTARRWEGRPHNARGDSARAQQALAGQRPTFHTNVINGLPALSFDGGDDYTGPSVDSTYNTAVTYFVVSQRTTTGLTAVFSANTDRLGYARATSQSQYVTSQLSDTTLEGHSPGYEASQWQVDSFRYNGSTKRGAVNKFAVYQENATGNLGLSGTLTFGNVSGGGAAWTGYIAAIIIYNRALTVREINQVEDYLLVKYGFYTKAQVDTIHNPPRPLIAFMGGSNIQGASAGITAANVLPRQVQNLLGGPGAVHLANHGMASTGANEWPDLYTTKFLPSRNAVPQGYSQNIAVVYLGGITGTAAESIDDIETVCTALQTNGWKVVIATLAPNDVVGFNTKRALVNADIVANWENYADALADIGADPTIGEDGDEANTTYYQDGQHWTAAGAAVAAGIVRDAISQSFFNAAVPATIVLSENSIAESAATSSVVGLLSTQNGSGTYTFTITADPDNKFAIANDNELQIDQTLDYETKTSHLVTVEADNGVDDPISRQITINVLDVVEGGGDLGMEFNEETNSQFVSVIEEF
jgi:hypothetical protein